MESRTALSSPLFRSPGGTLGYCSPPLILLQLPLHPPPSPPRPLTIANNRCAVERERSPSETETEQCVCRSFSQELVHAIRKFGDGDDDRKHHLLFLFPRPPSSTKLPWQTAVHQVLLQEKATGIRPLTFQVFFFSFLPEDVASTFRAASVGLSCQQKGPASLPPPVSVQRKWTAARDLHITDTRGTCGARD